ncbi:MAG: hypothetical protein R2708_18945 [Vicinamibacterales bacterium]
MSTAADAWLRRIERDTLIVALVMAAGALAAWPGRPGRAAGVLGGLALIALSYQGIRAGVSRLWVPPSTPGTSVEVPGADPPARASSGFVKFFTRHAILAAGAYVMMARFDFDPMAMLAGVTAPAIAAGAEVVRTVRARQSGPQSR